MKSIKRTLVAVALVLATTTSVQAGCLSAFAQYMDICDNYTSGFREVGCKMDAAVEYYACIGRAALG